VSDLLRRFRPALETVAWTAAFALSYAQSPLYTSNQNQYFLHGLARAGVGFLKDDWLARTADPTVLFSWLVAALASWPWIFYLLYAALMGVYLYSLLAIGSSVVRLDTRARRRLALATLLVVHSAALRYALARWVAPEAEFLIEGGVAGQRLLGPVLQPSSFGVLLVLSIALYLKRNWTGAVLALAVSAAFHPTYLLSAGILLAAYIALQVRRPDGRRVGIAMLLGGGALLAAVAVPVYLRFHPSGPDLYAIASDILIRLRIPHHAIPIKWLDFTVALQGLIVLGALVVVRRSTLFPILLVGTVSVVGLTLAQMLTGNPTLALLFPWRLSTVLVPVSSACLASAGVAALAGRWERSTAALRIFQAVALLGVGLAVIAGIVRFRVEQEQQTHDPAAGVMGFVARTVAAGDLYFIPPKLQDFRLRTGAPIVVDAKAIPYIDREVVDWWDRLRLARFFFRERLELMGCSGADKAASAYGATHVVLGPEQLGLVCPRFVELYNDGAYAVYRIR
jgi:hypothetical protein